MKKNNQRSKLCDPYYSPPELRIDKATRQDCLNFLEKLLLIREVETTLASGRERGLIRGPVHLGVGQEAVAVGISKHLNAEDAVFGAHRSHSHIIALGTSIRKLFCEILARKGGLCEGKGGSMHLVDRSVGFLGSVPIVAGTVPLAVGAALSSKLQKTNAVAIAYLGDGACEEGVVHESLNLAKVLNVPVLFVVENNLFASHMYITERQPFELTSRFATANGLDYKILDGNNVLEVSLAAKKFVNNARKNNTPAFIECITYRWYGHVDYRDDVDVGVNRSTKDLEAWKKRDPIQRLASAMCRNSFISIEDFEKMRIKIKAKVEEEWNFAISQSHPALDELYYNVLPSGLTL